MLFIQELMEQAEKDIISRLLPYFSSEPIIFDVGSNKGEWTDLILPYASEVHLFEPNTIFLHYTMVKYCERTNVKYMADAVTSNDRQSVPFYYFVQENNGLSSIYDNPRWKDLPRKTDTVTTTTLDDYCKRREVGAIDFVKVDVEGAELDVITGAWKLLKDKKIKFIQIEYSPHWQVPGYNMAHVIEFIAQFGYSLYNMRMERLETFEDDFREENFIIAMTDFAEDWNQEFIKNTGGMKFDMVLEIGCFDGLTTKYICDNLLNPGGRITCIDPLEDEYLTDNLRPQDEELNKELPQFKGQYERFIKNTHGLPVDLIRKRSQDAYGDIADLRYDLIYVDGDHREEALYNDAVKCLSLLAERHHARILFDDYEWSDETRSALDKFLHEKRSDMRVVFKDYQLMIRVL